MIKSIALTDQIILTEHHLTVIQACYGPKRK